MAVLAEHLPDGAAIWQTDGWTFEREIAAATYELLDATRIQVAMLTGDKKAKRMKPVRLPRPETVRPKKRTGEAYLAWAKRLMGR